MVQYLVLSQVLYSSVVALTATTSTADEDVFKFAIATPDGGGRCLLCSRDFKSLAYTRKHIEIMHTEGDPHECTVCGRVIANGYAFRTHMNLIHGCKGVSNVIEKYGRRLRDVAPEALQDNAEEPAAISNYGVKSDDIIPDS